MIAGANEHLTPSAQRAPGVRRGFRVLVAAPPNVAVVLERCLHDCVVATVDPQLSAARSDVDVLFLALDPARRWSGTLREFRASAPQVRIILCCAVADEPLAVEALAHGAADYCLWPFDRDELEAALSREELAANERSIPVPSRAEVSLLSDILRRVDRGPQAVIEGLAALVREVCAAGHASIEVDGYRASCGESPANSGAGHENAVAVTRDGAVVGRIVVHTETSTHQAGAATPLETYANLAAILVAQAREHEQLRHFAQTDSLSGLCNRRQFERQLQERLEGAVNSRRQLTLFLFDIDDFKSYNDKFGHAAGDGLVREIGLLLRRCSRDEDLVARYGGDEFAVIFCEPDVPRVPGSRPPTNPMALAARFSAAIAKHHFECLGPQAPGPVTISGGLASHPWDARTAEELIAAADRALLEAKRSGKNRIVLSGGGDDATL